MMIGSGGSRSIIDVAKSGGNVDFGSCCRQRMSLRRFRNRSRASCEWRSNRFAAERLLGDKSSEA
jgi:hypothetical protein